jgi:hypothetical protein
VRGHSVPGTYVYLRGAPIVRNLRELRSFQLRCLSAFLLLLQLAGVITAFRMEGFCAAMNIIGQSVWKDVAHAWFG